MFGRKYDVIHNYSEYSRESNVRTLVFRNKVLIKTQRPYRTQYRRDPPSDNDTRRWLKQFQETGSVLYGTVAGTPSTWKEDVDRIQEAFSSSL
jgi:hypothetical protein